MQKTQVQDLIRELKICPAVGRLSPHAITAEPSGVHALQQEKLLPTTTRESMQAATKTQHSQK